MFKKNRPDGGKATEPGERDGYGKVKMLLTNFGSIRQSNFSASYRATISHCIVSILERLQVRKKGPGPPIKKRPAGRTGRIAFITLPVQSANPACPTVMGNLGNLNYVRSRVVVIEDSGEGINRYLALCCRLKHPAHLTRRDKFFVLRLMRG